MRSDVKGAAGEQDNAANVPAARLSHRARPGGNVYCRRDAGAAAVIETAGIACVNPDMYVKKFTPLLRLTARCLFDAGNYIGAQP